MARPVLVRDIWRVAFAAAVAVNAMLADHAMAGAADVVTISSAKLERLTDAFNNQVATGIIPGAVVLIEQHGRPVYLRSFGVRDVATRASDDAGYLVRAAFDDQADHQRRGDDAGR